MKAKDPFRPADNLTECPTCGTPLAWNTEDKLGGQMCVECNYVFSGKERRKRKKTA